MDRDAHFDEQDLVNLPEHEIYLKLTIDGVASEPFSATTLPPVPAQHERLATIVRVSRERYGQRRDTVEEKLRRYVSGPDRNAQAS